jgi:hypothetical protein
MIFFEGLMEILQKENWGFFFFMNIDYTNKVKSMYVGLGIKVVEVFEVESVLQLNI